MSVSCAALYGGTPRKNGWGSTSLFLTPVPYLWPKFAIFPTLFMTWPKIRYPNSRLSELTHTLFLTKMDEKPYPLEHTYSCLAHIWEYSRALEGGKILPGWQRHIEPAIQTETQVSCYYLSRLLLCLIIKTVDAIAASKTTVIELTEWLSTNVSVLLTMWCSPSCYCSQRWSEYGTAADLEGNKTPRLNIFWETAKWRAGQSLSLFWYRFSQPYPYWACQARYTLMEPSFMLLSWATFWFVQQQVLCTFQCFDGSGSHQLMR